MSLPIAPHPLFPNLSHTNIPDTSLPLIPVQPEPVYQGASGRLTCHGNYEQTVTIAKPHKQLSVNAGFNETYPEQHLQSSVSTADWNPVHTTFGVSQSYATDISQDISIDMTIDMTMDRTQALLGEPGQCIESTYLASNQRLMGEDEGTAWYSETGEVSREIPSSSFRRKKSKIEKKRRYNENEQLSELWNTLPTSWTREKFDTKRRTKLAALTLANAYIKKLQNQIVELSEEVGRLRKETISLAPQQSGQGQTAMIGTSADPLYPDYRHSVEKNNFEQNANLLRPADETVMPAYENNLITSLSQECSAWTPLLSEMLSESDFML